MRLIKSVVAFYSGCVVILGDRPVSYFWTASSTKKKSRTLGGNIRKITDESLTSSLVTIDSIFRRRSTTPFHLIKINERKIRRNEYIRPPNALLLLSLNPRPFVSLHLTQLIFACFVVAPFISVEP
jgi:hypothetical protein